MIDTSQKTDALRTPRRPASNGVTKQPLRSRIMGSIYLIFLMRKAYSGTAIKAYVLGISLGAAAYAVSLGSVLSNLSHVQNAGALYDFLLAAIINTEAPVQLLLITAALAFVLMVRDLGALSRTRRAFVAIR